jgi:hypothetical protein
MRSAAGLHGDQAGRCLLEKAQNLGPTQFSVEERLAVSRRSMNLKDILAWPNPSR